MAGNSEGDCLLMDRDGMINKSPGLGCYLKSWEIFAVGSINKYSELYAYPGFLASVGRAHMQEFIVEYHGISR